MHVGEPEVAATVAVGEFRVIESEQVQHRGLQVVHVHRLLHGLEAELVGGAIHRAPLHAAAGHPDAEAMMVVVAAAAVGALAVGELHRWRAAELSPPEHERALEEPEADEIVEQRADRPVALLRQPPVVFFDLVVAVPRLPRAVPYLHVADAPLHEPPGDQHLPAVHVVAVAVEHVLRLARHVECVARLELHPPRELHRGQAGFELRIVRPPREVVAVEGGGEVELAALGVGSEQRMADVLDEFVDGVFLRVDVGALERARQKCAPPVFRALDRIAAGAHGDESGQILVLRAEPVGDPGAGRWPYQPRIAAVHQHQRWLVIRHVGAHRSHDEQPVGVPGHGREEVAHLEAALTVPREPEGGGQGGAGAAFGGKMRGDLAAGILLEQRLAVESIEVARAAVGEDVDHGARPRREMRRPGGERGGRPRGRGGLTVAVEQVGCGEPPHTQAGPAQGRAA